MELFTIGFTKKTAEQFFTILQANHVECVIDIRRHPSGQLAGFTKREDLPYFLAHLIKCDYRHSDRLTPTEDMLADYRRDHDWSRYAARFTALLTERDIPATVDYGLFHAKRCCLLCSEPTPEHCHRSLVAERIAASWPEFTITHL
jgi:uncharacterized protein (DUF488 family)